MAKVKHPEHWIDTARFFHELRLVGLTLSTLARQMGGDFEADYRSLQRYRSGCRSLPLRIALDLHRIARSLRPEFPALETLFNTKED